MSTSYVLYEVDQTAAGNGLSLVAISKDKSKLETFCKNTFGKEIGKPEKFTWDPYYLIEGTKIEVL